jgi:hypothetical protein
MADFQHRHYAHVAALLASFQHTSEHYSAPDAILMLQSGFADMFKRDNPRFDRDRFMNAAKGNPTNKDRSTARRRMGEQSNG